MKHIFLVNPKAGKGRAKRELIPRIHAYFSTHTREGYQIVVTDSAEQCEEAARQAAAPGTPVRIYACGGDGTLDTVLNGMHGFDNAALGFVPFGTANDFIRSFGPTEDFMDLDAQIRGEEWKIDLIRSNDRYALNQCSVGMDAEVCAQKDRFSSLPLISGQPAYVMSLLYCFFGRISHRLTVTVDDGEPVSGEFLFAIAANGRFCGGGFQSAPGASLTDGKLDCLLVRAVSRGKILSLISRYQKGTHLSLPICTLIRGERMVISCEEQAAVNLDGEVHRANQAVFSIEPQGVRFIVPGPCTRRIKEKQRRASALHTRAAGLSDACMENHK